MKQRMLPYGMRGVIGLDAAVTDEETAAPISRLLSIRSAQRLLVPVYRSGKRAFSPYTVGTLEVSRRLRVVFVFA
jgi:hypothetical protein